MGDEAARDAAEAQRIAELEHPPIPDVSLFDEHLAPILLACKVPKKIVDYLAAVHVTSAETFDALFATSGGPDPDQIVLKPAGWDMENIAGARGALVAAWQRAHKFITLRDASELKNDELLNAPPDFDKLLTRPEMDARRERFYRMYWRTLPPTEHPADVVVARIERQRLAATFQCFDLSRVRTLSDPPKGEKSLNIDVNSGKTTFVAAEDNPRTLFHVLHRIRVLMHAYAWVGVVKVPIEGEAGHIVWCSFDDAMSYYYAMEAAVRAAPTPPSAAEVVNLDRTVRLEWLAHMRREPTLTLGEVIRKSHTNFGSWLNFAKPPYSTPAPRDRNRDRDRPSGSPNKRPPSSPGPRQPKVPRPPFAVQGAARSPGDDKEQRAQVCLNFNRDPASCPSPCKNKRLHACSSCNKRGHGASTCKQKK